MIRIFLDGKEVIPAADKTIKMAKENPDLTKRGEYSLEIELPMDEPANKDVFGSIDRLEASKGALAYECFIEIEGKRVAEGNARVVKVSDTVVTVQFTSEHNDGLPSQVAGKYIDEVYIGRITIMEHFAPYGIVCKHSCLRDYWGARDYNGVVPYTDMKRGEVFPPPKDERLVVFANPNKEDVSKMIDDQRYWKATGNTENGEYFASADDNVVFVPVYNETENAYLNDYFLWQDEPASENFSLWQDIRAPQVRLFYLVEKLFYQLGYEIDLSDYSGSIYSCIYVANARCTQYPNYILPHWTVKELMDQLSLFLQCDVTVDEVKKTVKFRKKSSTTTDMVELDVIDSYDAEINNDEAEELENKFIQTSNIGYELSDSHDYDYVENDLLLQFERQSYSIVETEEWRSWSEDLKAKYIYEDEQGHLLCYVKENSVCRYINQFGDIIKNEIEDVVRMKISPVALKLYDIEIKNIQTVPPNAEPHPQWQTKFTQEVEVTSLTLKDSRTPIREGYADVWEEINGNHQDESEPEDMLQVFFFDKLHTSPSAVHYKDAYSYASDGNGGLYCVMNGPHHTDAKIVLGWTDTTYKLVFFDVYNRYTFNRKYFPQHSSNSKFNWETGEVEVKEDETTVSLDINFRAQHQFHFLSSTPPDVSKVFLIRGKRYLCEKVEYDIREDGIDPLMTGYFYEITE